MSSREQHCTAIQGAGKARDHKQLYQMETFWMTEGSEVVNVWAVIILFYYDKVGHHVLLRKLFIFCFVKCHI